MKILIAIDGSKDATAAVESANRLLSAVDRDVDLISVAPKLRRKLGPEPRRNGYERRALREITQQLNRGRAIVGPKCREINLITDFGSAAAAIVDRAEDYDLTVVGPKGRGTAGDVGLGPVASRVAEHALAPVLIAREMRAEAGAIRVLAAVDGSTASLHAIETLGELFDLGSAEVCLMHVAETPWIELGPEEDWVTYSDEDKDKTETAALEEELVREGDAIVNQARGLLRPYRVSVTTRTEQGNPANEILSEAERGQYDLIVLGATGVRDLKHQMLGSVSSKIAWNAPCSVLIVREPE